MEPDSVRSTSSIDHFTQVNHSQKRTGWTLPCTHRVKQVGFHRICRTKDLFTATSVPKTPALPLLSCYADPPPSTGDSRYINKTERASSKHHLLLKSTLEVPPRDLKCSLQRWEWDTMIFQLHVWALQSQLQKHLHHSDASPLCKRCQVLP